MTLALIFVSSAVADVVVLTEESFEKEVGQDRGALVEFYAPWYIIILNLILLFTLFDVIDLDLYQLHSGGVYFGLYVGLRCD